MLLIPRNLVAYRRHTAELSGYNQEPSWTGLIRTRIEGPSQRRLFILKPLIERLEAPVAATFCVSPKLKDAVLCHWRARCYPSSHRIARLPIVLRELVTLRYHRFSTGLRTAMKDLLFDE